MMYHQDIAVALGKTLWTTDLFMPYYRLGEIGAWKINPGGQLITDWGYHTGSSLVAMQPSLSRKRLQLHSQQADGDQWEIWMSLTPHEIESQELGCRHAFGHTVIMGLGMGWLVANVALNPHVAKITVIEIDADVIDLFGQSGALESLPPEAQQKITIIQADALEWRPAVSDTVHFLCADIWLHLAEPGALNQVRQMQANIQAERIYYWGQEIAIYGAVRRYLAEDTTITEDAVHRAIAEVIGLPLLYPDDIDYPERIDQVIQNRIDRQLPVAVHFSV